MRLSNVYICILCFKVLVPLCTRIENDLRLETHGHLQLDDRNPFRNTNDGVSTDLVHFVRLRPVVLGNYSCSVKREFLLRLLFILPFSSLLAER